MKYSSDDIHSVCFNKLYMDHTINKKLWHSFFDDYDNVDDVNVEVVCFILFDIVDDDIRLVLMLLMMMMMMMMLVNAFINNISSICRYGKALSITLKKCFKNIRKVIFIRIHQLICGKQLINTSAWLHHHDRRYYMLW